jgi:hypothetical protein
VAQSGRVKQNIRGARKKYLTASASQDILTIIGRMSNKMQTRNRSTTTHNRKFVIYVAAQSTVPLLNASPVNSMYSLIYTAKVGTEPLCPRVRHVDAEVRPRPGLEGGFGSERDAEGD